MKPSCNHQCGGDNIDDLAVLVRFEVRLPLVLMTQDVIHAIMCEIASTNPEQNGAGPVDDGLQHALSAQ